MQNVKLLKKVATSFPFLVKLRRYYVAYKDSKNNIKKTYSQFGEDLTVFELLPGISPANAIYIEVGANQPTQISNTYMFYRMGFHGIVIEPNREMSGLFRHFRPGDIHLEIGCAENSGVSKFKKTDFSVTAGFSDNITAETNNQSWVPLLTVDEIWRDAGGQQNVFLLSIDTEGFDLHVLKGSKETLKHTACIIVETSEDDINEINEIMLQAGFKLIKTTDCNYIWLNEETANNIINIK
jgi:FkbM family methyltransferase